MSFYYINYTIAQNIKKNRTVDPCDDFFAYSCNGFIEEHDWNLVILHPSIRSPLAHSQRQKTKKNSSTPKRVIVKPTT